LPWCSYHRIGANEAVNVVVGLFSEDLTSASEQLVVVVECLGGGQSDLQLPVGLTIKLVSSYETSACTAMVTPGVGAK